MTTIITVVALLVIAGATVWFIRARKSKDAETQRASARSTSNRSEDLVTRIRTNRDDYKAPKQESKPSNESDSVLLAGAVYVAADDPSIAGNETESLSDAEFETSSYESSSDSSSSYDSSSSDSYSSSSYDSGSSSSYDSGSSSGGFDSSSF